MQAARSIGISSAARTRRAEMEQVAARKGPRGYLISPGRALAVGLVFVCRPSAGRSVPTNCRHGPQRGPPDGYSLGGAARELVAAWSRRRAGARGVVRYCL